MKRFLSLLLVALIAVSLTAMAGGESTSSEEKRKRYVLLGKEFIEVDEEEENPFFFVEGDFYYMLEELKDYPSLNRAAIVDAEMAAKVAGAILRVDLLYQEGMLTKVYHDVETDIWIVRFSHWPPAMGGGVCIALSGEDGHVIKWWGTE